ncbi:tetratricopeptide repeat protein, partial [Halomonas sp. SYSU XM8]
SDPRGLVEQDIQQARIWFTRAAEQGDAESASQLAGIYRKGLGVPKDERAAFEWLKRAENMPFDGRISHGGLAVYYEEGIGTEVDLVQAYKYYDLRDPAGAPDKRRLAEQMTPDQIRQAIELSRAWQEEHGIFVPSYYGLEYQPDGSFK